MAGVLRPKAVQHNGSAGTTEVVVNIQPPSGKIWWFRTLRYAMQVNNVFEIRKAGTVSVTEQEFSLADPNSHPSGETSAFGTWATSAAYIQLRTRSTTWSLGWMGVEADL